MRKFNNSALALGLTMAVFAVAVCSSDSTTTTSSTGSGSACLSSSFGTGVPSWVSDNFSCVQASVSGSSLVIKTNGMPPYNSAYFGSSSTYYEAMPSGRSANPNTISTSRTYTMTVPSSPSSTCVNVSTSLGEQGILANGVIVYNNAAAPGDTLSSEVKTFDGGDAHPDSSSIYHNHTQPVKLTSNTGKIIGIAIDGFPILDSKELDGTSPSGLTSNTHGHSHSLSGGGKDYGTMYHYHIANDSTAGISTILGDKLCASQGSITKN